MGGGGKGGKTKIPVADYLMSMHFGICKGQLDSVNQVYVKELPVWCGKITENGMAYVHSPNLFGGDKKEGGVSGVLDVYLGTPLQKMFTTTAVRYGLTPDTMWGYRGVASIMFRGYHPEEAPSKPEPPPGIGGIIGKVYAIIFPESVEGLFPDGPEPAGGFKWISNNPYLPGAWVNATRLPKGLSSQFSAIYSGEPDYLEEKAAAPVALNDLTFLSIAQLGWTAAEIDAGEIGCTSSLSATFTGTGLGAGLTMSGFIGVEFQCYADNGSGEPGALIVPSRQHEEDSVSGGGSVSCSGILVPGTRHVRFHPQVVRTYPVFSTFAVKDVIHKTYKTIYGPSYCTIENHLGVLPDANPAHMIYEALTDTDTGMGAPRSDINIPSFMAAAETFYNERFGLSMLWASQTEIEKYISEILDHVQATLFIDPRTGLWTLTPFRADYDAGTLPLLDPSNCTASNRQRKALGETVNEIVVTWTNPNNEQEETISFQDLGNIGAQGGVVSDTRNYYGIRNIALANKVGQRDIRSASYPLFSTDIVANRTMSFLRPGSVVRFSWPEDGIVNMVLRVLKVDYGKPGEGSIKLTVIEDVFGLETTEYTSVQESVWVNPDVGPTPMNYTEFLTAPLPMLIRTGFVMADLSDDDYPVVATAVLSKRQTPVENFDLMGPVVKSTGEVVTGQLATLPPTSSNLTTIRLVDEVESYLPDSQVQRFVGFAEADTGDFLHIEGPDGDRSSEIIMLDRHENGVWTVARGMFDTVIRDWPIGTRVWYWGTSLLALDPTENNSGVESTYQLLPRSAGGQLKLVDAPVLTFTPSDRPYAPFRPSNIRLTAVGGTPSTTWPLVLENPGAESNLDGWTETNMAVTTNVAYSTPLTAKEGTKFFVCDGGAATASMEQRLSVPPTRIADVDAGEMEMSVRWWQAGFDAVSDPSRVEVDFFDHIGDPLGTFVSDDHFSGAEVWEFQYERWVAPVGTRSYIFRFNLTRTVGTNLNCHIDDIKLNLSAGEFPPLGYMGSEVPTSITVEWSHRNRLTEDTVAMRWTEGSVTPEVGQTTTVRVVDAVDGTLEFEEAGITGTSYSLALGSLVNYRFYRIEVIAVRDGFESIQAAYRDIQVVQLGYGNNYGYDYGENDGS